MYFIPCSECDGSGNKAFNVSLYEYVGLVEVSGAHVTREGRVYSVRYHDLSHVPEMARNEESKRRWRQVDSGILPMSSAKWANSVPEDCLYTIQGVAQDVAHEFNLDILQGFTTEQAQMIIKMFDTANDSPYEGSKESGANHPLPREMMGEFPQLTYDDYNKSLSTPRLVTESDYRQRHANVKIESVLT